ncbi:MAG TPA: hypothetical protein VNR70_09965 [Steroidobacteraceae bacterium]|nr:hypothetical protein [Steroidobacteraceae bacterium]
MVDKAETQDVKQRRGELNRRLRAPVFATGMSAANALVNERLVKRFSSNAGHIIVRVSPGGADYCVVVTDNADEADRVVKVFGPYESVSAP